MGQEAGLPMFVQGLRLCVLSLPVDAFAVWAPADNILRGSGEREKLAMERSCKDWLALRGGRVYLVVGKG